MLQNVTALRSRFGWTFCGAQEDNQARATKNSNGKASVVMVLGPERYPHRIGRGYPVQFAADSLGLFRWMGKNPEGSLARNAYMRFVLFYGTDLKVYGGAPRVEGELYFDVAFGCAYYAAIDLQSARGLQTL
jgi:hypothetical protein